MVEQIWLIRNQISQGSQCSNWEEFSRGINTTTTCYDSHKSAPTARQPRNYHLKLQERWFSPQPGEMKLNFDAAFFNGKIAKSVVLQNLTGEMKGGDNSFCAETEAAIQTVHIGISLNLESVTIEGDALFVILTLQGMMQFEDWRAKLNIEEGQNYFTREL